MQVQSIVGTLLEALPTPSYSVQEAVSDCLAPLMAGLATDKAYVQSLAQRLLDATLSGPDYPHRYQTNTLILKTGCCGTQAVNQVTWPQPTSSCVLFVPISCCSQRRCIPPSTSLWQHLKALAAVFSCSSVQLARLLWSVLHLQFTAFFFMLQ